MPVSNWISPQDFFASLSSLVPNTLTWIKDWERNEERNKRGCVNTPRAQHSKLYFKITSSGLPNSWAVLGSEGKVTHTWGWFFNCMDKFHPCFVLKRTNTNSPGIFLKDAKKRRIRWGFILKSSHYIRVKDNLGLVPLVQRFLQWNPGNEDPSLAHQDVPSQSGSRSDKPTWSVPSRPARGRPAACRPGQLNHEGSPPFPLQHQEKLSVHGGGGQRLSPGVNKWVKYTGAVSASLPVPLCVFLGGFQGY